MLADNLYTMSVQGVAHQSQIADSITKPMFKSAFIAATALLDELEWRRPSGSRYEGAYLADNHHRCDVPIVFDTGCSFSITPFQDDFVTELEDTDVAEMTGLTDKVQIQGQGWVEWIIRDHHGQGAKIRTQAYFIPLARIRLHSPHNYLMEYQAGSCYFDHTQFQLTTPDGIVLRFEYDTYSNLPLLFLDRGICQAGLTGEDALCLAKQEDLPEYVTTIIHDMNYNITAAQKELLLWHNRLGHAGMSWIQSLMRTIQEEVGNTRTDPYVPTRHKKTRSCTIPKCASCQLGKQYRRTPNVTTTTVKSEMEMALKREHLQPGDCVSMDQYVSKVRGRLPNTFGKESDSNRYSGGTIYVDHSSGYVFIYHQVSLRVGDTLQGKHEFERMANEYGIKLKHFHADNHPFGAEEFLEDLELQGQTLTRSGVGAHHANGVAERTIKTITTWSRSMMMHLMMHWPEQFNATLWPFAMEQATYIWNSLPNQRHGQTPTELFTKVKQPTHDALQRLRVMFCPVFVLDPRLQDGKKLPKWTKRSRIGMYVGISPHHSSTIGRILSLDTGAVSPQYHDIVVYDELFSSVFGMTTDSLFKKNEWQQLIRLEALERTHIDLDADDDTETDAIITDYFDDFVSASTPPPPTSVPEGESTDAETYDTEPESDTETDSGSAVSTSNPNGTSVDEDRSEANEGVRTRYGRQVRPVPKYAGTFLGLTRPQPHRHPTFVHEQYLAGGNPNRRMRIGTLNSSYIQGLEWSPVITDLKTVQAKQVLLTMLHEYDIDNHTLEQWHPMALAAKANDADTPNWNQAMNGPNADGFWEACRKELDTLVDMEVWDVVDREPWMSVIPTTWAFKIKRFPSGEVRKLKSRLCVRGDKEIENVHYWETFAPVVSWTTVRLLLILSAQLGLETLQVDYTAAFVHADVETPPQYDDMTPEEQYRSSQFAEMPRGFAESGKVLKLKKNLYGKKAAPRLWFNHLKSKLTSKECGFKQMIDVDPCLFISNTVICLVYVDDTLLYARTRKDIDNVINTLREQHHMTLEVEDSVAGFLGVHIERDQNGTITLTQKGLIDRIIEALHIENLPGVDTPATECLGKDPLGDAPNCTFNYASVIGMLWYVYGHSRPDLGFAVSQAARFTFQPKRSHELALIRIGQYLKKTRDKGLVIKPMSMNKFAMDVYVDSDFLGIYGKEERTDIDNVRSRGGHVFLVNGCPIIWQSKLIDAVCLSTMMAEYYALSIAMREVLPLRALVRTVAAGLKIDSDVQTNFKVTVWEDNMGCLTLANLDPGQTTPRSKFYDSKVHWFRSHLSDAQGNEIRVVKVDTALQIADLFTKPLAKDVFERLRKMLLGW